jgi:hypothetical protein
VKTYCLHREKAHVILRRKGEADEEFLCDTFKKELKVRRQELRAEKSTVSIEAKM